MSNRKSKEPTTEDKVKAHLDQIYDEIEGGWEALLAILNARWVVSVLTERRKTLGVTQRVLAERLGVTQSWVNQFENARYPDPHLSTIQRHARALDCEVTFGVEGVKVVSHSAPEEEQTEETEQTEEAPA